MMTQFCVLLTLLQKAFENILEKGENAGNQHFLLYPKCFLPYQIQKLSLELHLILWSAQWFKFS